MVGVRREEIGGNVRVLMEGKGVGNEALKPMLFPITKQGSCQ